MGLRAEAVAGNGWLHETGACNMCLLWLLLLCLLAVVAVGTGLAMEMVVVVAPIVGPQAGGGLWDGHRDGSWVLRRDRYL